MKAIILGAGQGKRLLPLTENRPKALLSVAGRSLVAWQIRALAAAGVDEVVFISGFRSDQVETAFAAPDIAPETSTGGPRLRILHNPFYTVADNISSCWVARGEMSGDFLLMNGDTLFQGRLLKHLLSAPAAAVTLAVDQKDGYDPDDMKVRLDGTRLTDIGKTLPLDDVDAESIGCMVFRGAGPKIFADYLDRILRDPENLGLWYLSVIRQMALDGVDVRTSLIAGYPWCEVDYIADLERAERLLADWDAGQEAAQAASRLA